MPTSTLCAAPTFNVVGATRVILVSGPRVVLNVWPGGITVPTDKIVPSSRKDPTLRFVTPFVGVIAAMVALPVKVTPDPMEEPAARVDVGL